MRIPWVGVALLVALLPPNPALGAQPAVALKRLIPQQRLVRPVFLAELPDGSGVLVVVEQAGRILRFRKDGQRAEGVLLDIRSQVSRAGNEEGLLSVAFHPRFAEQPYLYVYYSAASPRRSVLARFRYDATTQSADPASRHILMEVPEPYANHNGGQLAFGPDGDLYVGLGDGGSGGDPHGNGQNKNTLLGKILRIDVDHPQPPLPYGIPADNPFAGRPGMRGEIWAYGLRNPWRFAFDRATGNLYAGDVGQDAWEEVDRIVKGGNYGWNTMEGTHCYDAPTCSTAGMEMPIAEYGHDEGNAVTGGYVYRGQALPGLQGRYVFGDFGSGTVWSIPAVTSGLQQRQRLMASGHYISSFGEDAEGELYLLDLVAGEVFQLVPGDHRSS